MNRVSAALPPSFMMFAAAQVRDSGLFPKRLGAVPRETIKMLKRPDNYEGAAHAAAQLAPFCGTFRVPLLPL
ncbi:MAG: hypothetical protein WCK95_21755 [Alphaproteobacteria bacterium]|jgi:hypothetical protein